MALFNGKVQSGIKSHKVRNGLILAAVAVSFYAAGFLSKTGLAAADTKRLESTCRAYVNLVVNGELDKSYEQSADSIKNGQTVEAYKQELGKLKSDKPQFTKDLSQVTVLDGNTGSCVYNIEGLPAANGEKADGTFNMGAVKNGLNWKISGISVE